MDDKLQTFSLEAVSTVLEGVARQIQVPSPEVAALIAGADAQLFIFAPPLGFVSPDGRVLASIEEIDRDMERGRRFIAALAPWVAKVEREASPEQLQFLRDVGLSGSVDEGTAPKACSVRSDGADDEGEEEEEQEDDEHRRWANEATVPEPARAVAILEGMLSRYDPRSAAHTCIDLALATLRFIVATGQVEPFLTFLDEIKRPHTPMGAPAGAGA